MRSLVAALVALAALCAPAGAQQGVPWRAWAQPFEPTTLHELVYRVMEACVGRPGQYDQVTWLVADQIEFVAKGDTALANGVWDYQEATDSTPERRLIVLDKEKAFDGYTISEEALHDIYGGVVPMDVGNHCRLTWKILNLKEHNDD